MLGVSLDHRSGMISSSVSLGPRSARLRDILRVRAHDLTNGGCHEHAPIFSRVYPTDDGKGLRKGATPL